MGLYLEEGDFMDIVCEFQILRFTILYYYTTNLLFDSYNWLPFILYVVYYI
jgi:hypothetical protein